VVDVTYNNEKINKKSKDPTPGNIVKKAMTADNYCVIKRKLKKYFLDS
jgi:hypothetical protein